MPGDISMASMTDSHRLFLQAILSRHILSTPEVRRLYRQSCERFGEVSSDDQLAPFVVTINQNISPIHMEIKKGVCEETGANYYALMSTQESTITKCSPDYTVNELELFKKIVEKIVESENGTIKSIEATNLCDELERKINKKDGDEVIARMVDDKWFLFNNGKISLHTRALLELEQYLKEQFPEEVVCCELCKKVCLKGQCCTYCPVKLHHHCAKRFFNQGKTVCPARGCGKPWPSSGASLGQQATTTGESSQQSRKRRR